VERQHVLTNTLVLEMADNGRPFPRAKTRLHDCAMKTPFIACCRPASRSRARPRVA
jgi:hypothetical protein